MEKLVEKIKSYGIIRVSVIAILGIFLLVISIPWEERSKKGDDFGAEINKEENNKVDSTKTEDERRLISVLEKLYGAGNVDCMITKNETTSYFTENETSKISGIIVIVRCNQFEEAQIEITNMISALFDVPIHKIVVIKME